MADNNSLNINSVTPLVVTKGGTGANNASSARSNLGAAASGANADITSLTGLTGVIQAPTFVNDTNGNHVLGFLSNASAVNYLSISNQISTGAPILLAEGTDTDISIALTTKGIGAFFIESKSANPIIILSGTSNQHQTTLAFANTSAVRTLTFPDANGTVLLSDTNNNMSANNFISGYATTATSAGTTTLTVASAFQQYFTGTATQTVVLPVTSTLVTGFTFKIVNNSTMSVTINSSGGNIVDVIDGGLEGIYTCILTSGTTAASWSSSTNNPGIAITGTWVGVSGFTIYQASSFVNGSFLGQINAATYDSGTQNSLTTLDLGSIGQLNNAFSPTMTTLTSFSAPSLINTLNDLSPTMALLTTLSLPALQNINGSFSPTMAALSTLSLPLLAIVNTNFSPTMNGLSSYSTPDLTTINGNFSPTFNTLTSFSLNTLTTLLGNFGFSSTTLTSFSMTGLTGNILSFQGVSLPALSTFSLPISSATNGISFNGNELSTSSWSFPNLATIGQLPQQTFNGATLSLPSLTTAGIGFGGSSGFTCPNLTSFSISALVTGGTNSGVTGSFHFIAAVLPTLNLSSLATIASSFNVTIASCTSLTLTSLSTIGTTFTLSAALLTTLSLSSLTVIGGALAITAASMTTFSMNSGLLNIAGNFTMTGAALNQASVDGILVSLANLNGTGGTTSYNGHTVNLSGGTSATPSATGLAAKVTLTGRGNTVTTN